MEYTRINGYDENIAMLRRRLPVLTFAFDSLFKQPRYLDHFDHYNNKEMTDTSCVRARIHENTRHRMYTNETRQSTNTRSSSFLVESNASEQYAIDGKWSRSACEKNSLRMFSVLLIASTYNRGCAHLVPRYPVASSFLLPSRLLIALASNTPTPEIRQGSLSSRVCPCKSKSRAPLKSAAIRFFRAARERAAHARAS